ncbi:MAG: LysR substrate-binding domain-containing protein [Elstera sp.]
MDRLSGMAVFAAVVECEGFTAAAKRLNLSKAAVSKQVSLLEERLGARLLNRTTRRLSLTDVGQSFYDRCQRILAEAEEAVADVGRLQTEPRGPLRVSAPASLGETYLSPVIAQFAARWPDLRVDLDLSDRYVDLVEEGYDLALRVGDLADSSLISKRLATVRRPLVAAPAYLARYGTPRLIADLPAHRGICYSLARHRDDLQIDRNDGKRDYIGLNWVFRSNNGRSMVDAACHGLGLLATPLFLSAGAIQTGQLVPICLDDGAPSSLALQVVFPHARHVSTKVRLLIDTLAATFRDPAPWEIGLLDHVGGRLTAPPATMPFPTLPQPAEA